MTKDQHNMLHFGYGSNMLTSWTRRDASSAVAISSAVLSGYRLSFRKVSSDGRSGKGDIVADPKAETEGVLFAIARTEINDFNDKERNYKVKRVNVTAPMGQIEVWTYTADESIPGNLDEKLQPFDWYRELIVAGAEDHGLTPPYIEWLKNAHKTIPDTDPARIARARRALTERGW